MRRLLQTKTGQVLSHIVAAALILPSVTFGLARRAEAQLQQNPTIAVVNFRDLKNPDSGYGAKAAESLSGYFGQTGSYDVVPRETIQTEVENLGLKQPLANLTNVLRVGQQLRLTRAGDTIVSGEVVDYRVRNSPEGKMADVSMRVIMTDVPSGIAVNGAGVSASSTVRSGDVSDETLITDAISAGANAAVQKIRTQTLPTATIQNTYARSAIINQGARSGFTTGQEVIVSRGREQVATAQISDIQPGSATIVIKRSFKGLQPGDRVRAVFSPPDIVPGFDTAGGAKVRTKRRNNNLSGLITVALVLGVAALLLTGGNNRDQDAAEDFTARPTVDPTGTAAVQLNWSGNGFAKGNFQKFQWQIYRDDNNVVPALVVPGTQSSAVDGQSTPRTVAFDPSLSIGGFNCPNNGFVPQGGTSTVPLNGRPYQYSIELVYVLQRIDTFAGVSTGNVTTTGTNTGTTTATTTTGGTGSTGGNTGLSASTTTTTGTTTTGSTGVALGDDPCFFVSSRTNARGLATPLTPPTLVSPANNGQLSDSTTFTFQSSAGTSSANTPFVNLEYVLQLSTTPRFTENRTYTSPAFTRSETGVLSTGTIDTTSSSLPSYIRNATTLYARVGVRNVADRPGPVRDRASKQPYIFGGANLVTRPGTPPPPPA